MKTKKREKGINLIRSIYSILGIIISIYLIYTVCIIYLSNSSLLFCPIDKLINVKNLYLVWSPIILYILISSLFLNFINIFIKLENWKKEGLINWLIICLILSLFVGLMYVGYSGKIIFLPSTLLFGLILGFIVGSREEFYE